MFRKPEACRGCPLYQTGQGFVPDQVVPGAKVFVMMQNPGEQEEQQGVPAVGKTGQIMDEKYLPYAGLSREEASVGNAIRCRWKGANELPGIKTAIVREAITHCRVHQRIAPEIRLIIAQGDHALWSLTGEHSSTDWRGWLLPQRDTRAWRAQEHLRGIWTPGLHDLPVLATVHIARLFRPAGAWLTMPTARDWDKAGRVLAGRWPMAPPLVDRMPPLEIDSRGAVRGLWPTKFAFDTEWDHEGLTRYSMAWRQRDGQPWVVACEAAKHVWPAITSSGATVITQNVWADMRHLTALTSVRDAWMEFKLHDLMLAHSVLYSDFPHDLDFIGSLSSSMNRWKHLRGAPGADQRLYAGADAWGTWECWEEVEREFRLDPRSKWVYDECVRPQIPVIAKATEPGIRTWEPHVMEAREWLELKRDQARAQAQAAAGWPLNLGSNPQVGHQLYVIEGRKPPRKRGMA